MAMKKLINKPEDVVKEALQGMEAAYAGQIVMLSSASSRVIRSAGNQPPAGQPSASWRVMAECEMA